MDMLVLDSIASMAPSVEIEESSEKWQQGLAARLMNKAVRRIVSGGNHTHKNYGRTATHIWINQVRDKIGVMFGEKTTIPGGKAQKFAASIIVGMWANKWETEIHEEELVKLNQMQMGTRVRINWKVKKNKTAPAQGQGSYVLLVSDEKRGQIDDFALILELASKYGELVKEKTKWRLGVREFKTKTSAINFLLDDPSELISLRNRLIKLMMA